MRLGAIHCTKVTKKIGFSKSNFSNYVLFDATLCLNVRKSCLSCLKKEGALIIFVQYTLPQKSIFNELLVEPYSENLVNNQLDYAVHLLLSNKHNSYSHLQTASNHRSNNTPNSPSYVTAVLVPSQQPPSGRMI